MSFNGREIPKEIQTGKGENLDAQLKMSQAGFERPESTERNMAMNVGQTVDGLLNAVLNVRNAIQQNPKLAEAAAGLMEGHEHFPIGTLLKQSVEFKPGQDQEPLRTALMKTLRDMT